MLAVSFFVFAATDTLISLGLAESKIFPAAPVDTPRTPFISFCSVQLRTLCVAHFLATLCLSTTSGPDLGASGAPWSSAMPPFLGRGRVTNNNKQATGKQIFCITLFPSSRMRLIDNFLTLDDIVRDLRFLCDKKIYAFKQYAINRFHLLLFLPLIL